MTLKVLATIMLLLTSSAAVAQSPSDASNPVLRQAYCLGVLSKQVEILTAFQHARPEWFSDALVRDLEGYQAKAKLISTILLPQTRTRDNHRLAGAAAKLGEKDDLDCWHAMAAMPAGHAKDTAAPECLRSHLCYWSPLRPLPRDVDNHGRTTP